MRYKSFTIENYRAIKKKLQIDLKNRIIPLVGINECGKTTILQAIFCFDRTNDEEYDGKHLTNLRNLYETDNRSVAIVTADIETTVEELDEIVEPIISKYKTSKQTFDEKALCKYEKVLANKGKGQVLSLQMQRNLTTHKYSFIDFFNELPEDFQNTLGDEIVGYLPYILYNDDFNDRPPDAIPITTDKKKNHSGWEAIFDRVFESTDSSFSLSECLANSDEKMRKSILSDVEHYLNEALTKEWQRFSTKREKISIQLNINKDKSTLEILIKDYLNGRERFFNISDRSKGFIWYYNFIMKVRFNPKHTANIKDTIFLLDEPGSYLHDTAQISLCKKLKDISADEGVVVYCTHSPKLLLPQYIPINNIIIVDKSNNRYISAKNLSNWKSTPKRNTAMQPVFDALMIPEYEAISRDEKILCVEGIYDKYALELFSELPKDCRILAGVNADSIISNIQYLIAYRKKYIALWDNDDEGNKCFNRAKNAYGEQESQNFMLLPKREQGKRRMEEMFEQQDFVALKEKLQLPESANYESVIAGLYFLEEKIKSQLVKMVSETTKSNFRILSSMIAKHFSE